MILGSICRIARLDGASLVRRPREAWQLGDYVVGRVIRPSLLATIELESGRSVSVEPGDLVVGALGDRAATLELTGSWTEIGDDGEMVVMTGGALIGSLRSKSPFLPEPLRLQYAGHAAVDGVVQNMELHVPQVEPRPWRTPSVLIVGSSMSSGKTASARILVRRFKRMGLRVIGAKLTGAARYRDMLSVLDSGADHVFDFVDAGLPSTVVDEDLYRRRTRALLSRMAALQADVAVIEAGASPLEPYNGLACVDLLGDSIRATVLCASDPYAVAGITQGFGRPPDLVAGIAANTDAGRALVGKLTGLPAVRLTDPKNHAELDRLLRERVLSGRPGA